MTRVGVIGPQNPDSFADNVADGLEHLDGVTAVRLGTPRPQFKSRKTSAAYDFAARASPEMDARVQHSLVRRAAKSELDLIVSVQSELHPSVVGALRANGIPVVLWFPDHIANLGRGLMFAADYSAIYFKDPTVVKRVSSVQGIPAAYLPEAMNPRWHRPQGGQPGDTQELVLAGNIYPTRALLLERLAKDAVPLRLYGESMPTWIPQRQMLSASHTGQFVRREEKSTIFRTAQAVLNNLHPSELDSMNCRLFEAAGAGAAIITEYRSTLPDLFDIGSEVLSFSTYEELLTARQSLVDDPGLGVRLGDAAASRALAEHTYQHRLTKVLEDQIR